MPLIQNFTPYHYTYAIGGTLSLIGSAYLVAASTWYIRKVNHNLSSFAKKLIVNIGIADLLFAATSITFAFDYNYTMPRCKIEIFFAQLGLIASAAWNCTISFHLFLIVYKEYRKSKFNLFFIYGLFAWAIPCALAFEVLYTYLIIIDPLGECIALLPEGEETQPLHFLRATATLIFLLISYLISLTCTIAVTTKIRKTQKAIAEHAASSSSVPVLTSVERKLYLSQFAFLIIWTVPLICSLIEFTNPLQTAPWFIILQTFSYSFIGFVDAIIFYDSKLGLFFWRAKSSSTGLRAEVQNGLELREHKQQLRVSLLDEA